MDLAQDWISQIDACNLAGLSLDAMQDAQYLIEKFAFLLNLPLTDTAVLNIVLQCTILSNEGSFDEGSTDDTELLLQLISADELHIPVSRIMWIPVGMHPDTRNSRLLTAVSKGRSRASGGDMTSMIPSADVSSQEWTVRNLAVEVAPRKGTVLHPRVLGWGNEILGGLELTQTRLRSSFERCGSNFQGLVTACRQLTERLNSNARGSIWLPFGRDPSFNPLSVLFSKTAANRGEEQYYNMSSGSQEVTEAGFPAAFFPTAVHKQPKFLVVFPVRYTFLSHCTLTKN